MAKQSTATRQKSTTSRSRSGAAAKKEKAASKSLARPAQRATNGAKIVRSVAKPAKAQSAAAARTRVTAGSKVISQAKAKSAAKATTSSLRSAARTKSGSGKTAAPIARTRRVPRASTLGRPRVPGDAALDLVFRNDFKAREICDFLGVKTVKELEQFHPDEIIHRLTGPMIQTVGRIRKALAIANRCLKDDEEFALEFRDRYQDILGS